MKKITALVLTLCMLAGFVPAQAQTTEEMLFSTLPQFLFEMLTKGFDVELTGPDASVQAGMYVDEEGPGAVILSVKGDETGFLRLDREGMIFDEGEGSVGIRWETVLETLLAQATGMEQLPTAEDWQVLADLGQALSEAVQSAVTLKQTALEQEDGSVLWQTEMKVGMRTLLEKIDQAMAQFLSENGQDVENLLRKYAPLLELGEIPTAAQLEKSWQEMQLSSQMPMDLPLTLTLTETADGWQARGQAALFPYEAEYAGGHLSGSLNVAGTEYAFDTRDLETLLSVLLEALQGISPAAFDAHFSSDANAHGINIDASFRIDCHLLIFELHTGMLAAIERQRDVMEPLFARYAVWNDMDAEELKKRFLWDIDGLWFRLMSLRLPVIEAGFELWRIDDITRGLRASCTVNGYESRLSITSSSFDPLTVDGVLTLPDGKYVLSGSHSGYTGRFSLYGTGDDAFSAALDLQPGIAVLTVNDFEAARLTVTDEAAELLLGRDVRAVLERIGDSTLYTCFVEGVEVFSAAAHADGLIRWKLLADELLLSGEMLAGQYAVFSCHEEYEGFTLRAERTDSGLSLRWHEVDRRGHEGVRFSADVDFSQPSLQMSYVPADARTASLSAARGGQMWTLSYQPGRLFLGDNSRSISISDVTPQGQSGNVTQIDLFRAYRIWQSWTVETLLQGDKLHMTLSSDGVEAELTARKAPPVPDAGSGVQWLTAQELADMIAPQEPVVLEDKSDGEAAESSKHEAAQPIKLRRVSGKAQGFACEICVNLMLDQNGTIVDFEIDETDFCETTGFGAKALEEAFQAQFIGMTPPLSMEDIDAIAGATITSQAVVDAINQAAEQ